ncbi:MAG TPA: hypothetical protein VM680_10775 [Verrucomicrobiae bacterium]|nr:hypothetical protein [Verrucomicrobiae bacterium]
MGLMDGMDRPSVTGMAIARRDVSDVWEAMIMAAVMQDLGGNVFTISEDQSGRWHVWARFRSGNRRAEKIDTGFEKILKRIERNAALMLVDTKQYVKAKRSRRRADRSG